MFKTRVKNKNKNLFNLILDFAEECHEYILLNNLLIIIIIINNLCLKWKCSEVVSSSYEQSAAKIFNTPLSKVYENQPIRTCNISLERDNE